MKNSLNFKRVVRAIHWRIAMLFWPAFTKLFHGPITTFKLDNNVFIDYPTDTTLGRMLWAGLFEEQELQFIKDNLRVGDVFIDIGANAGVFSIIGASIVGSAGKVYAFEVSQKELDLLNHNVVKYEYTNIEIIPYAVSNQTGRARFAIAQDGAMNSLAQNNHPGQIIDEWVEVNTITLDEAVIKFSISKIDAIKMDVEGAEKLIFEGGMSTILEFRPKMILFESSDLTNSGFNYSTADLVNYLLENGLHISQFVHSGIKTITSTKDIDSKHYNFIATFTKL